MRAKDLYERDFFEWTQCNAALLRARRFEEADIERLAEEIEDMGRDRRELTSRLEVLITHLLKWLAQPTWRERATWRATTNTQRRRISKLLGENLSLASALEGSLGQIYGDAVKAASDQTRLPRPVFPAGCPFSIHQILDEEFFPQ